MAPLVCSAPPEMDKQAFPSSLGLGRLVSLRSPFEVEEMEANLEGKELAKRDSDGRIVPCYLSLSLQPLLFL